MLKLDNTNQSERILFLNPMGSSSKIWYPISAYLQAYEICFCDYPGFDAIPYQSFSTISELAESIKSELDDLSSKPTHIVGFSFGSWLTQHLVCELDFSVESVTLIGSSERIYRQGREMIGNWKDIYERTHSIEDVLSQIAFWSFYTKTFESVEGLLKNFMSSTIKLLNNQEVILDQMSMALKFQTPVDLSKMNCPTLILRGKEDAFYPRFCSQNLVDLISDAKLIEIPETAHAVVSENPRAVAKEINSFLTSNLKPIDENYC